MPRARGIVTNKPTTKNAIDVAMLDALGKNRKVRFISTRHEQTAAHAADGYARASGKPGVLLTHLGPGLTNAATGVANAQGSTNVGQERM